MEHQNLWLHGWTFRPLSAHAAAELNLLAPGRHHVVIMTKNRCSSKMLHGRRYGRVSSGTMAVKKSTFLSTVRHAPHAATLGSQLVDYP